jgi:Zn ribbon nucleic-acid-binding protein
LLDDPGLKELVAVAEQKDYLATINNRKEPWEKRLNALEQLTAKFPHVASSNDRQFSQLRRELAQAQANERSAEQKLQASFNAMKWWEACIACGHEERSGKESLRREVFRRQLVNNQIVNNFDLSNVNGKTVNVGMTTCGVYAVLGRPDAANVTKSAMRQSVQLVYRDRGMYVYTDAEPDNGNGVVRSIQY